MNHIGTLMLRERCLDYQINEKKTYQKLSRNAIHAVSQHRLPALNAHLIQHLSFIIQHYEYHLILHIKYYLFAYFNLVVTFSFQYQKICEALHVFSCYKKTQVNGLQYLHTYVFQ
jgi:hypothetical protein